MDATQTYYANLAQTVIDALAQRQITGYYAATKEDACSQLISLLTKGETISWGGSMTLEALNIFDTLEASGDYTLLDRSKVAPEDVPALYRQAFSADTYLMSSNAITLDGKLVNIDGTGNRIAALIFGPKQVIVVAGMNKIATDEFEAITRVHNVASPQNAIRLNKNTPCAYTGKCHDCLSPDCICAQTVITRNSREAGRIKVILVGEVLGY